MAWAITEVMKRTSNLEAQAITEAPVRPRIEIIIRLKGGEYASTDEPLSERVLYDID